MSHNNTIVGPANSLEIIFRAKTGFVTQYSVAFTAGIISQNMNLSDEDIQRIVDRLRPTLPRTNKII